MPSRTITPPLPTVAAVKVTSAPTNQTPFRLDNRFAEIKKQCIKPEHVEAVKASYERLKVALKEENENLVEQRQAAVPEIEWAEVLANGGDIPAETAARARKAGCILFRGLIAKEKAEEWGAELKKYTQDHRAVGGKPLSNPCFWLLYWTRPQVQARSHPDILKAMKSTGKLWNIKDETLPIDLDSQAVYADRFRIRKAGDKEFVLKAHLDSSAIERWEDPLYRSNYQDIFEGNWEKYDPWCMDNRPNAKVDLYNNKGKGCSAFRALQGWLSMSNCGPGEGTLRLLPSLKLSTAYMMLRPFFLDDETFDNSQPTFPGALPGAGQLHPTSKYHPHLEQERVLISVPKVHPGDYMFWHADLIHEVEDEHNGTEDGCVFYNASTPLCPYNITSMLKQRKAFREVAPPPDFYKDFGGPFEIEAQHDDHGARIENILTYEGKQGLGLAPYDENEPGLTVGQRTIRKMANDAMKE